MDTANRVQILDDAVCISYSAYILWKGMNLTILLPVIGKIVEQAELFILGILTCLGEGKFWIQIC